MPFISKIISEEIVDSNSKPTLKTAVYLDDGAQGTSSVPSGASIGSLEALELRDQDPNRYNGMGVLNAVNNAQGIIFQAIKDINVYEQDKIDRTIIMLDGTFNKSKLGANAILSVSLAAAVAASLSKKLPLFKYLRQISKFGPNEEFVIPRQMINLIEGGKHVKEGLDFQEFLVVPKGTRFVEESYAKILKLIESLKSIVGKKTTDINLGMEGGFTVNLTTNEEALKLIRDAMENVEFSANDFDLALDIAAMSVYQNGEYRVRDFDRALNSMGFIEFLANLAKKYNLYSIEDPLSENDWIGWKEINKKLSPATLVVGDDITVTNQNRLTQALETEAMSAVIIKPNQIGTLSETLEFAYRAHEAGLKLIVSHRSGETEDTFISDLAVAINAELIKIGSPLKKERYAKYNRLIEIEKELWRK